MIIRNPARRRVAGTLAWAATALCAVMLLAATWTTVTARSHPAWAAVTNNGAATMNPTTGDSSTAFNLSLGTSPTCPGDNATGNYLWQTFMVDASVDIATVQFGSTGPVLTAAGDAGKFAKPLYNGTGSRIVNKAPDVSTAIISGIPTMKFANYTPGAIPAGSYKIGIACTLGPAGVDQLKTYWSLSIAIASNPSGADPAQITFGPAAAPTTTTTAVSTTTSTTNGSTTTTVGGSTTTTTSNGSTTTLAGASATTTTTPTFGGEPAAATTISAVGALPITGTSTWSLVVWAILLVVFGRMALLLSRKPKVIGTEP